MLHVIPAVAVQQLKFVSAAAAKLKLLQLIAAFSLQPMQWVSADAGSFQLWQLLDSIAMHLLQWVASSQTIRSHYCIAMQLLHWVSAAAASFQLLQLIATVAMQSMQWVSAVATSFQAGTAHCWTCNATVEVCFCSCSYIATVAANWCNSNVNVAVSFYSCRLI